MRKKTMTIGMTATFLCLVFLGAFLAQGYEMEDYEPRCAIERNVTPSYSQRGPNVNKETIARLSSEASIEDLENAYYYQMIEDEYIHINDCKMEVAPLVKSRTSEPFAQAKHNQSCDC